MHAFQKRGPILHTANQVLFKLLLMTGFKQNLTKMHFEMQWDMKLSILQSEHFASLGSVYSNYK